MTTFAPKQPQPRPVREGYRLSLSYHTPYENATYQVDTQKPISKKKIKQWIGRIVSTIPTDDL